MRFALLALCLLSPMAWGAEEGAITPEFLAKEKQELESRVTDNTLTIIKVQLELVTKDILRSSQLSAEERLKLEGRVYMTNYHLDRAIQVKDEKIKNWEIKSALNWLEVISSKDKKK